MSKRNAHNERIKHQYWDFLRNADGKSEATIRQVEKAILRYEEFTRFGDFRQFDQRQATAFKSDLARKELAPATILSTITSVKRFFGWLATQSGYKRAIRKTDIEYLNLPEKTIRAASAPADRQFPTLHMIEKVVDAMPYDTPTEKRDRALVAFTAITGIRDGALISLKLKHFDKARMLVLQNPKEVTTKFGKQIDTFLFPLNDNFEQIVLDWMEYLSRVECFGAGDPIFPSTNMGHDGNSAFVVAGLNREHWKSASPIRKVFRKAFENIGLPVFTPHRFRDMIVSEMYRRGLSVQEFKAWSQNLGHEGAMTTLTSYGKIGFQEQGRLVRQNSPSSSDDLLEKIRKMVEKG